MSRAFDLALFVGTPVNVGDAAVVSALGPPFAATFSPVAGASKPGVVVGSSVPAATAQGQSLLSGPGPDFVWGVITDPAASASVPPPTAINQVILSDGAQTWQVSTIPTLLNLGGAVTNAGGGAFIATANVTFAPSATIKTRIDGGDPTLSVLDNFSWDAGTF